MSALGLGALVSNLPGSKHEEALKIIQDKLTQHLQNLQETQQHKTPSAKSKSSNFDIEQFKIDSQNCILRIMNRFSEAQIQEIVQNNRFELHNFDECIPYPLNDFAMKQIYNYLLEKFTVLNWQCQYAHEEFNSLDRNFIKKLILNGANDLNTILPFLNLVDAFKNDILEIEQLKTIANAFLITVLNELEKENREAQRSAREQNQAAKALPARMQAPRNVDTHKLKRIILVIEHLKDLLQLAQFA